MPAGLYTMPTRRIVFIGYTELGISFYKRFSQAGYSCSFLTLDFTGDVCDLATRMYFPVVDPQSIEGDEIILFSDSPPQLIFENIDTYFKGKKVLFFSYYPVNRPINWSKIDLVSLESAQIFVIRSFGNYSASRLESGSLYFHSETIFCTNKDEIAIQAQKILFSIGIKAFYAGPLRNESMVHALSKLETAITTYDKLHQQAFFKILNT